MKKVILSAAIALACVTGATAQKQQGGENNLEVQFAPLGGNPVSITGIRFRKFNSEASAIRLSINVTSNRNTEITQEADDTASPDALELVTTDKSFGFSIRPGYEKHFAGTDRLSPYVGAELLFAINRNTTETESQYQSPTNATQGNVLTQVDKGGTNTIGLNLVAGTDFYFADNLYLGAEIGFGFASTRDIENETSYDNAPDGDQYESSTSTLGNTTSRSIGAIFQGSLRLGWLFN